MPPLCFRLHIFPSLFLQYPLSASIYPALFLSPIKNTLSLSSSFPSLVVATLPFLWKRRQRARTKETEREPSVTLDAGERRKYTGSIYSYSPAPVAKDVAVIVQSRASFPRFRVFSSSVAPFSKLQNSRFREEGNRADVACPGDTSLRRYVSALLNFTVLREHFLWSMISCTK